jgi:iron complex transport system permease protein
VGADHRWSLPVTLLATPALLLFADVVGRLLTPGNVYALFTSGYAALAARVTGQPVCF